jgi:uncharacterized protein (TIGR03382 family)
MVQTCKKGFQNICFTRIKEDWDLALLYIAISYKMSKHASLSHFSPYFLLFGRHPIHPLPLLLKWIKLWTWIPQPLGLGSSQKGLLYSKGLCPWPWKSCPLHNIKTPLGMHTHEMAIINLRWDNLMLVTLCISSSNLMILWTLLLVALSWGLRRSGLQMCWSCKKLTNAKFRIISKIVRPTTFRTLILPSSRQLGFLHLTIHVRYVKGR